MGERQAVIVGIGEVVDREDGPQARSPRDLIAEAIRRADADAGRGLAARADRLVVINVASFAYDDLPGLLASDIGANPAQATTTPVGGDMPINALAEAGAAIVSGEIDIAVICGGEALRTRMKAAQTKRPLGWGPADPNVAPKTGADYVTPLAARYRLTQPSQIYPLYENAFREKLGQSLEVAQRESAELWSQLSRVAATNETAWTGRPHTPEQIAQTSPDNRLIAFPYPKLMNAQLGVNQACALLVVDIAVARAAGIADARMIHIGAAVRAVEPGDFLARDRFDHAAAQEEVLASVLSVNRVSASDIDLVELYSCFPIVPKMARRLIGLRSDIAASVTGGLTFFGGPANNYMTHAVAAVVRALRQGKGRKALLYGQGEFVTKHAAIVLRCDAGGVSSELRSVQAGAEARRGPIPPLLEEYRGPAILETYTILFDRNGEPEWAPVVLRTPQGDRVLAAAACHDTIAFLLRAQPGTIGASGMVDSDEAGLLRWTY